MHKTFHLVLLAGIICLFAGAADAGNRLNMRGERYGEVLLGKGGLLIPNQFDVYNTIGLNNCPEELWSKLNSEQIKKETGAKAVKLNGPRYWVIDGIIGSSLVNPTKRDFGGIAMREAGILDLTLSDKFRLGRPYIVHKVARKTTWLYKAERPVYQLISPDGTIYFMQSYSAQKTKQTPESLPSLATHLHLPNGWKYRSLKLKNDFNLSAENGMAYVVQDDLDNTYQKSLVKETDSNLF